MRPPSPIAALVFTLAVAYCQNDSDLIQKYQQAIQANPRDSSAHYQLAEIYFQQKNFQTAANEYRQALNGDLQPALVEILAHLGLAKVFDLSGQADRAENERRQAARSEAVGMSRPKLPPAVILTPVERIEPEYSEEARAAGLEGIVFVSVILSPDGTPADARVESPLGLGLDEKALDAVRRWRFSPTLIGAPPPVTVPISFVLPSKFSRWHLVGASFQPPDGVTRPVFLTEPYPPGAGISNKAIDEGWVISAIPRSALVKIQFDVEKNGVPTRFRVLSASAELWGDEAIAVLRRWRFTPGAKDGESVAVPCTVDLVWGGKVWTPETLAKLHESMLIAAKPQPKPSAPLAVEAAESQTNPP